jgi:hypothetical protein
MGKQKKRPRKVARWSRSDKLALTGLVIAVALWLISRLLGG